jgi:23S rRNA (cytosine1962-C5)-methyltransferase
MQEEKKQMFINRLTKVYRHCSRQARRKQISCYRIYDHDLPEFPFAIDFYDDRLNISEYRRNHGMDESQHAEWLDESIDIIASLTGVSHDKIFMRQRQRKAGRQGQYEKIDSSGNEFIVTENNLKFKINLSDYLDTGLFLDHRLTREMVKKEAGGKKLLNLFCYTGSFSVYAAAGDADEVVSVDLSNTYLKWAQENMKLNGYVDPRRYKYMQEDVLQLLPKLEKKYFDLIILDPPTFSNSKRMDDFLDIQRDHVNLINQCLDLLKPQCMLFFSTNFTKFVLDEASIKASSIRDITKASTPFDFEGKLKRWCYRMIK